MKPSSDRSVLFLDAMGVGPLWLLRSRARSSALAPGELAPTLPKVEAPSAAPGAVSMAWFDDAPVPAPVPAATEEAIARMDWAELKAAAAACTRCDLCRKRERSVFGRGGVKADWLLLGSGPSRADEKAGQAVSGAAGVLLGNMLLAIGQQDAYVTNLVKCRAQDGSGADRAPLAQEVAACRPFLERELSLTQSGLIVALGQPAASALLGHAERGTVHQYRATPVVASIDPEALLCRGEDKAKAWADLCLAGQAHGRRA